MATTTETNPNAVAQQENERNRIIAEAERAEERRLGAIQEAKARKSNLEKQNKSKDSEKEGGMSNSTFRLMLGAAIFVDILTVLINLIPVVGGFIADFTIQPMVIIGFAIWCKVKGIPAFKKDRIFWTLSYFVIGFIPVLSALPEWTMQVITQKARSTVKKELKQISRK
jgi:hypothetical protein